MDLCKAGPQIGMGVYTTRNQALRAWFYNSRCGGILIKNRNQNHLLCAVVFDCFIASDCMVYPDPIF